MKIKAGKLVKFNFVLSKPIWKARKQLYGVLVGISTLPTFDNLPMPDYDFGILHVKTINFLIAFDL